MERNKTFIRFVRSFFGWMLMIPGGLLCLESVILAAAALLGGLETESFGERLGFAVTFAAMAALSAGMVYLGFRLKKPSAAKRRTGTQREEAHPQDTAQDLPRKEPGSGAPEQHAPGNLPPEKSRNDPLKPADPPARQDGTDLYISGDGFTAWKYENRTVRMYELRGVMALTQKEPVITLYEDGVKAREYCLQTEGDEDFTGKYFHFSLRMGMPGNPPVYTAQLDGFVCDTPEPRSMTYSDIGCRMEGYYLTGGTEAGRARYENLRGQDLVMKGLKYPGYTTPANVRLIGVCPDCGKSFAFHGYVFYMDHSDVAYSDDGLDCCVIEGPVEQKEAWAFETGGKVFRYYNSFCCPHCGAPYIDYRQYPRNKVFGASGCVHLGRKEYRVSWEDARRPWTGRQEGTIEVIRSLSRKEDTAGACFSFEKTLRMEDLVKAGEKYYLRVTEYLCTAGANGRPDYSLTETYFEAEENGSRRQTAAWVHTDGGTGVLF